MLVRKHGTTQNWVFFLFQLFPSSSWWIQFILINRKIYYFTDSAFVLGLVSLVSVLPIGFVTLLGGYIADTRNPRKILLTTQVLLITEVVLLRVIQLTSLPNIFFYALALSFITAVDSIEYPARLKQLSGLTNKTDFGKNFSYFTTTIQASRIIGPFLASFITNETVLFGLLVSSYLLYILFLLVLLPNVNQSQSRKKRANSGLLMGLQLVIKDNLLRYYFALILTPGFFLQSYIVILPAFANSISRGSVDIYGYLMSLSAFGSSIGSIVSSLINKKHRLKYVYFANVSFGITLLILANVKGIEVASALVFCAGVFHLLQQTITLGEIQEYAPVEFEGRIGSLFYLWHNGLYKLGGFFLGFLASNLDISRALVIVSVIGVVWTLMMMLVFVTSKNLKEKIILSTQKVNEK